MPEQQEQQQQQQQKVVDSFTYTLFVSFLLFSSKEKPIHKHN